MKTEILRSGHDDENKVAAIFNNNKSLLQLKQDGKTVLLIKSEMIHLHEILSDILITNKSK